MKLKSTLLISLGLILLFSFTAIANDSMTIRLKSGSFVPLIDNSQVVDLSAFAGKRILIQFDNIPDVKERKELKLKGITLLKYVPENAYIAHVDPRFHASTITGIRWADAIAPIQKISPRVAQGNLDSHALRPDGMAVYEVTCHKDASMQNCKDALLAKGAEVRNYIPTLNAFQILIDASSAFDIAESDLVEWVAQPTPPFGVLNDQARPAIGADIAYQPPYSVTGAGIKALVYDGSIVLNNGSDASHTDLKGRLVMGETFPPDIVGHSTHVSCTVGGSGAASSGKYQGMAPGIDQIVSMAYTATGLTIFYNNPGDIELRYKSAIQDYQVSVANNSIGANVAANNFDCSWEGDYEGSAALIDEIIAGKFGPITIVWANGNERGSGRCGTTYGTTPPPLGAKNIISVGAVNSDDNSMTDFSSWGPMDDGRLHPDVVAPGSQHGLLGGINSCSYGSLYMPMSGTSMAAPVVTGASALLMEMWHNQISTADPSAAMMKALFIHGAQDLGNPGPDYQNGYGLISVPTSLDLIKAQSFAEVEVDQGENLVINFIADGTEAKFTLVWSDPPGTVGAAKALVNDLDIKVIDPSENAHLPFVLNPSSPDATATTGADHVNVVEQVLIDNTQAQGTYEIVISGNSVPSGPQTAALVVSGGTLCAEEEICGNGKDDNCDGQIDEGCGGDDDDDTAGDDDNDDTSDENPASSDDDDDDDGGSCFG